MFSPSSLLIESQSLREQRFCLFIFALLPVAHTQIVEMSRHRAMLRSFKSLMNCLCSQTHRFRLIIPALPEVDTCQICETTNENKILWFRDPLMDLDCLLE